MRMSKKAYLNLQGRNTHNYSKLERNTKNAVAAKDETKNSTQGLSQACYKIKFICHRPRLMDLSNLCIKYFEDMIVEAGIIPEDNYQYVKAIELVQVKSKEAKTVVEVYQILED